MELELKKAMNDIAVRLSKEGYDADHIIKHINYNVEWWGEKWREQVKIEERLKDVEGMYHEEFIQALGHTPSPGVGSVSLTYVDHDEDYIYVTCKKVVETNILYNVKIYEMKLSRSDYGFISQNENQNEVKKRVMKVRFFYAKEYYHNWPKLVVLTSNRVIYCQFLRQMIQSRTERFIDNFENFKAEDYCLEGGEIVEEIKKTKDRDYYHWTELQPFEEISYESAKKIKLKCQENWIDSYLRWFESENKVELECVY